MHFEAAAQGVEESSHWLCVAGAWHVPQCSCGCSTWPPPCSPWGHWEALISITSARCALCIPKIPVWTNRMCLPQCSLALKMGEKLVFYFIACVRLCLGCPGWKSSGQGEQSFPEFTNSVMSSQGGFSCISAQWMLCEKEIVTMWWPSPLLGHCILADPKGWLRCRYFFSFASDLMWPSPRMITSHEFGPLLHFRKSCHQVCFRFHLTLEYLRGSISNSTLHATRAYMGITLTSLHFSDEGFFFFLEMQSESRVQFRNTKLSL